MPAPLNDDSSARAPRSKAASSGEPGTVSTTLLEGSIVETVYKGYMTVDMLEDVVKSLGTLMRRHKATDWLIDTSMTTGFVVAPRELMANALETFRGHGGQRIATVVPSAGLRMLSATFAFALRLPLKSFQTRAEALTYLRNR